MQGHIPSGHKKSNYGNDRGLARQLMLARYRILVIAASATTANHHHCSIDYENLLESLARVGYHLR